MTALFHFAFHVSNLETSRTFYRDVLGCREGRSTDTWIDFDFFGHQLSLHLGVPFAVAPTGLVGAHRVPMPHFGAILPIGEWRALADRLTARDIGFVISPTIRFAGEPGEQATMFFRDPSGNPIEVKGFRHLDSVYAT